MYLNTAKEIPIKTSKYRIISKNKPIEITRSLLSAANATGHIFPTHPERRCHDILIVLITKGVRKSSSEFIIKGKRGMTPN